MPTHQDDETRVPYKTTWRSLYWVLVLTSLIRCLFLAATYGNLDRDPDAYRKLAGNVVVTGVYGWKTAAAGDNGAAGNHGAAGDNGAAGTGGEVRPTAFRPPLYPALLVCLGGVRSNWPLAVLHVVLGVVTAGLVTCLGWRAELGRWGVAAGLLVAVDPILLNQSTLVMTETLAAFLAALALFCLSTKGMSATTWPSATWSSATWSSAIAGLVLGLCVLCRPTFLPWLGLIALARVGNWRGIHAAVRSADASAPNHAPVVAPAATGQLWHAAVLVGAALLVTAPWAIRNAVILGQAKLTTTHGGYTALLGNNPLFYRFLRSGSQGTWDGEELGRAWQGRSLTTGPDDDRWNDLAALARLASGESTSGPSTSGPSTSGESTSGESTASRTSELDDDRLAYALAKRYIREQPGMFLFASGLRICRLWRWVPHRVGETESRLRQALRYLVGVWYAVLVGLASFGLARLGGRLWQAPWLYGVQLCLVFTAVHAVYWSDMRMRAPLIPLVCLAAASGMKSIGDRLGRPKG